MLNYSREGTSFKKPAHINNIIENVISLIKNNVYFENVTTIKKLSVKLPELMIDVNQIEQVVFNLVLNAAEAITGKGTLILETQFDEDTKSVLIKVSDTGCGITTENIDKIFDPFFTTKDVGQGTGLGLAVSHGIIKRHDGQINVESKLGSGTTFTITLPTELSGADNSGGSN